MSYLSAKYHKMRFSKMSIFANSKFRPMFIVSTIMLAIEVITVISNEVIAGKMIGEGALSSVEIVAPVSEIAMFIAEAIARGTGHLYIEELGEFKKENAEKILGLGMILGAVATVFVTAACFVAIRILAASPSLETEISEGVNEYFSFQLFTILLMPLYLLLAEIAFVDGNVLLSILASIAQLPGNILLSIILCEPLGIRGISLGNMVGEILSIIILMIHIIMKKERFKPRLYFKWKKISEILRISSNDTAYFIGTSIMAEVLNMYTAERFGNSYIPVVALGFAVMEIKKVFNGAGNALSPIGNLYLAEKNYSNENSIAAYALKITFIWGLVFGAIFFAIAPWIPGIYEIKNPALLPDAILLVRVIAVSFPAAAVVVLLTYQLVLVKQFFFATILSAARGPLFPAILMIAFASIVGKGGVFIAFAASPFLTLLLFVIIAKTIFRNKKFPWITPANEHPTLNVSAYDKVEKIMDLRDHVEQFLEMHKINKNLVKKVMLIVEESGMLVRENNPGKKIAIEYTVTIESNGIMIISRDSGRKRNLANQDALPESFRKYVVASFVGSLDLGQNLNAMRFNRNRFFVC